MCKILTFWVLLSFEAIHIRQRLDRLYNQAYIDLIHTAYPKAGMKRKRTTNSGFFGMFSTRQGDQNNKSMGQVSSGFQHGYYDAAECIESLASHLYPTISAMATITRDIQETSGQIEIGTIRAAFRQGDQDTSPDSKISSIDICPYNIGTGPRYYPQNGWFESFANCLHRDGDTLNKEQSKKVLEYVDSIECPLLKEHFQRKEATFKDVKDSDKISLPSTCAWKQRERPEDYSYSHSQHFIIAEAGMSFNLSSCVYDNLHRLANCSHDIILGATFFGSFIGHLTSASLYEVEDDQGATTQLCQVKLVLRHGGAREGMLIWVLELVHVGILQLLQSGNGSNSPQSKHTYLRRNRYISQSISIFTVLFYFRSSYFEL